MAEPPAPPAPPMPRPPTIEVEWNPTATITGSANLPVLDNNYDACAIHSQLAGHKASRLVVSGP